MEFFSFLGFVFFSQNETLLNTTFYSFSFLPNKRDISKILTKRIIGVSITSVLLQYLDFVQFLGIGNTAAVN